MIAYLDMNSGISGDMLLGCLIDAGWSVEALREVVVKLKLPTSEWAVEARQVMKGPMRATLVEVQAQEGHVHRGLADIRALIEPADLPSEVKKAALGAFTRLAEAEAKVHGTTVDKIHFHEVGAVDAIIDMVGCCAGLHELGVAKLYASTVPLGGGMTRSAHGPIPLPAPATLEMLTAAKAPTRPAPPGEWVTPTGAALLCELATFVQPMMRLEKLGTGAGVRDCAWPNVARLWMGTPVSAAGLTQGGASSDAGGLVQLETNVDDMTPQLYGSVMEQLLGAGAKDVWLTPVQMKKGRPGVVVSVLTDHAHEGPLAQTLLQQTTTLGVRALAVTHRHEAQRDWHQVMTEYGSVRVKVKWLEGKPLGAMPEFDDCKGLAEQVKLPVKQVHDAATAAAAKLLHQLQHEHGGK